MSMFFVSGFDSDNALCKIWNKKMVIFFARDLMVFSDIMAAFQHRGHHGDKQDSST